MKLALLASLFDSIYRLLALLFPIKKQRVTFCTNRSDALTGNLKCLYNEMKADDDFELTIICFNFERTFKGRLKYFYYSLTSLYYLATSRFFIIDDYFLPIYCLKKKRPGTEIIQLWHAIGHLKKYGLSIAQNRQKKIRPHINYDWVFANSKNDVAALVESFDITEAQVIVTGAPRIDEIVQEFAKNPQPKVTNSMMYAPTYRNGNSMEALYQTINQFLQEAVEMGLTKTMKIYVSLHPYININRLPKNYSDQIIIFQDSQRSSDLLATIDYLITDYSSILLDYSFFERPILIFAPDYQEYMSEVGFFVEYRHYLNAPFYQTSHDLLTDLIHHKDYDLTYVQTLKADNFSFTDGKNSQRCVAFIKELMLTDKQE